MVRGCVVLTKLSPVEAPAFKGEGEGRGEVMRW